MGMYDRHAEFYDAIIYGARGRDPAVDVDRLLQLAGERGVKGPRSVLDVACGTGLHAAEFAMRVDLVVGVDLSDAMLDLARQRAENVEFHHADYRNFDLARQFDLVTCLFSAIGHAGDEDGLQRAMERMAAHVAPGGLLVVETWLTPEAVDPGGRRDGVVVQTEDGYAARLGSSRFVDGALDVEFAWSVATPAGCETEIERHRMPLFTRDEYVNAVAATGLAAEWMDEPGGTALSARPLVLGRAPVT